MNIEFEIRDLKRRVGDLEKALSALAGRLHEGFPEIEALRSMSSQRFDDLDTKMQQIVKRLDTLSTQAWSLRDDLPSIIADALRRSRGDA